ncbi:MAG: DNA mismatch repair endonuclease MutL [Chloroflexi bacterium]|nr:DNA mismatch repair endonuclease MutL [Chloroflexota bacterium]
MSIRILSPEVASKIAAGEVVERPASAVKELIENALDAGATRIAVEAEGGGVRLIRVLDNGSGMSPEEASLAFQRFATSKVASAQDLEAIATLGFRGEALPSIAAVAEVTMLTRPAERLAGTFLRLKGGQIVEEGQRGCPAGTTVTVRGLFSDVPARLKFLKSEATEASHISHLMAVFALAYPEVRFTLTLDGRSVFQSAGSGRLEDVLVKVFGLEMGGAMLRVNSGQNTSIQVWGFATAPSVSRARRETYFFVNRRWVQSRALSFAVEEAYSGLIMAGRHPLAVFHISLPFGEVDVNVHPTKAEVRFRDERTVFAAVQRSVRSALVEMAPVPSVRLQPAVASAAPQTTPLKLDIPFSPPQVARPTPTSPSNILRVLGQVAGTYIIAEGEDGVFLIDQHTAHETVLLRRLQGRAGEAEVQGLLEPVTLELSPRQEEALKERGDALTEQGFQVEPFGEGAYLLRGVPALLKSQAPAEALKAVLDDLAELGKTDDRGEAVAISIACHGAVRAGQSLTYEEMRELVRSLEALELPKTCPHGRPIMLHLSAAQLEREFGRR